MKKYFLLLIVLLIATNSSKLFTQNLKYVHKVLKDLTAKEMYGRAAYKNGDSIAAEYVAKEFAKCNLKSINDSKSTDGYKQCFNTNCVILENVSFELGKGNVMRPDNDYYVIGSSPTTNLELENVRPLLIIDKAHWELVKATKLSDIILVFDAKTFNMDVKEIVSFVDTGLGNIQPKLVVFQGYEQISYYIGRDKILKYPVLQIVGDKIGQTIPYIKLHIKTNVVEHTGCNVIGIIEGKQKNNYIFLTAHYDALGMFADKVFHGAHDNASGIATILDLANHYSKPANKPEYSLVIIGFRGEEIGLVGSNYYVENPVVPNDKIKLVVNLDLVGSGSGGLLVVNGDANNTKKYFKEIEKISNDEFYFHKISTLPHKCYSDHCAFVEKGIPAIFMMTAGEECKYGHSIYDNYENTPMTKYESLFRLIKEFITNTK